MADDLSNCNYFKAGWDFRDGHGYLRIRNRIYERVFDREWVTQNMPDAEVRRQRAAYRRGLLRAGVVAAVIITAIVGLALTAVKQRNRAKEQRILAERQEQTNHSLLYVAHMNLAQRYWETRNIERMRELIEVHSPKDGQEDLRGFE